MKNGEFNKYANKYVDSISLINSLDDWVYINNLPDTRQRVLDIGCGSGKLLATLSKYFDEAYGIDVAEEFIHNAKEAYPKLMLALGDANKLPYENNYFDMVVSHTTFHHLNRKKSIQELIRVLKNGGTAVIVDVARDDRKIIKPIKRLLLRNIYSRIKLIYLYGLNTARQCWEYSEGEEWRKHRLADKKVEFSSKESRDFYSKRLPGAKFKTVNYHMEAIIWHK